MPSSCHWPPLDVAVSSGGYHAANTRGPPHIRLWDAPYRGSTE